MKIKIIYVLILTGLAGFGGIILTACSRSDQHEKAPNIDYYTCSMHPQIHKDHPGNCPICGMTLVPVYTSPTSPSPASGLERGTEGVRISSERQQLIGLKTTVVSKGSAAHEIRTAGYIRRDLSPSGNSIWIDANLFPNEASLVKSGAEVLVTLPVASGSSWPGYVRSVDSFIDPATRSLRAHIEIPEGGATIRQHTSVNVLIKASLGEVLTIPRSAVIETGERTIAFVVKDGERFETRTLRTGSEAGDNVVVLEGLTEGETVVSRAAFLVDSESRLKEAVQ